MRLGAASGVRQSPIGLKGTPHPPPCGPPSPLGEGGGFSFYPSPLGRGGTARRWVRGLFASNAFMAPEVCDTRDFDGTLRDSHILLSRVWSTLNGVETIQVVLNAALLHAMDRAARRARTNRSALVREALREYLILI